MPQIMKPTKIDPQVQNMVESYLKKQEFINPQNLPYPPVLDKNRVNE